MKSRKYSHSIWLLCVTTCWFIFSLLVSPVHALDISVDPSSPKVAEQNTLQMEIYANNATSLISMGVKISFDPAILSVISATKNQDPTTGFILDKDGDPLTTSDQYHSPAVAVDNTNGTVTMFGGRMIGASTTGLSGQVLLGTIVFQALQTGSSPISVDLGKYHPSHPALIFDNFVNRDGSVDEPANLGNLTMITVLSDKDLDTLPDDLETDIYHTNPQLADTDGDGIDDGEELAFWNSMDCSGSGCAECWDCDLDGDGQANNLLDADADGDGYPDGQEIQAGTNPLDPDDIPALFVDGANSSGIEDGSSDYPYNTIGEAVAVAPAGYSVLVAAGTYQEAVALDKDIRLIGVSPSTTVIDGGGAVDAVLVSWPATAACTIKGFIITNAANGINCAGGASPLLTNNIITGVTATGVLVSEGSLTRIHNNTISENPTATGVAAGGTGISLVNNIITGNLVGISCSGSGAARIDYNNVRDNSAGDYLICSPGLHDISEPPLFVSVAGKDFHLLQGSACINGGDPVETLVSDYLGSSTLTVDEVTNVEMDDWLHIWDGTNLETNIAADVTTNTIDILGEFLHPYLIADGAFVFTDTSDAANEPAPDNFRIDLGAYGNTPEAGPAAQPDIGDQDEDGDVDGKDAASFAVDLGNGIFTADDLANFASRFGQID
jgi:hypothetical protein